MQMKPEEIRRSYEKAARKEAQIGILAELNLCQKEDIRQILIKQGIPEDELPKRRRRRNPAEPDTASISVEHGKQVREEILTIIIEYIEKYGYPPTVREIGDMTGLKSTCSVKNHLDRMVKAGVLETDHKCTPRAIRVPGYRFVKEEMDKLYLDRCEEINELKRQVEELRKAAGKQIPQKVNEDDCCPVCGTCGADDDGITGKYCMECGQKLDWSEKLQAAGSEEA